MANSQKLILMSFCEYAISAKISFYADVSCGPDVLNLVWVFICIQTLHMRNYIWVSTVCQNTYNRKENVVKHIWAVTRDFKQCGILTSVDSDEPVQPPFKLRNSKLCCISCLTVKGYLIHLQSLWSVFAYAQADLNFCWSHIQYCWKFHAAAHI